VADVVAIAGQVSDDSFSYNPGAAFRINPDGTGTEVIGSGFRNSYVLFVWNRVVMAMS